MRVIDLTDLLQGDFIITRLDEYGEEVLLLDSRVDEMPFDLAFYKVKAVWPMEFLVDITVE